MLDNPLYADPAKRAKIMAEMALLPESVRNTRLHGAWSSSDSAVYHWDSSHMSRDLPGEYSRSWRHVVSVDPALSSALGLTVWVEEPLTGLWYLVHAEQISGILDPVALEATVHRKTEQYNVVRRISDPHEVWYMQTASKAGRTHMGVFKKNERKGELIKNSQSCLGTRVFVPGYNTDFIDQLVGAKWTDGTGGGPRRIVNASSKHLLDSFQYFCDNIPKYDKKLEHTGWEENLRRANEERKRKEAAADAAKRSGRCRNGRRDWLRR